MNMRVLKQIRELNLSQVNKNGKMIQMLVKSFGEMLMINRTKVILVIQEIETNMQRRYGMNLMISFNSMMKSNHQEMILKDQTIKLMLRLNSWMLSKVEIK
jgi:hypothetical protein